MESGAVYAASTAAISTLNAQSSQGSIATMSAVSTVPPHHIRRPGGASRYAPISSATSCASSRFATALANAVPSVIRGSVNLTQTEVFDRVAGSCADCQSSRGCRKRSRSLARLHWRGQLTRLTHQPSAPNPAPKGNLRPQASKAC